MMEQEECLEIVDLRNVFKMGFLTVPQPEIYICLLVKQIFPD